VLGRDRKERNERLTSPFQFSASEVKKFKAKVAEIHDSMVDGRFVDAEGKELRGSHVVSGLVKRCLMWSDIVLERYAIRQLPNLP
jgi:hypothetical protein